MSEKPELIEVSKKGIAIGICSGIGMTNEAALGEFIDNALDEGASKVSAFATARFIVAADNGHGMDDGTLASAINLCSQKDRRRQENGTFGVGLKGANAHISKPLDRVMKHPEEFGLMILTRLKTSPQVRIGYLGFAKDADGFYTSRKYNDDEDRDFFTKVMKLCKMSRKHGTIIINARGPNVAFVNQEKVVLDDDDSDEKDDKGKEEENEDENQKTEYCSSRILFYDEILKALESKTFDDTFCNEQAIWHRVMHYNKCVVSYNDIPLVADGKRFIDPFIKPEKSSFMNIAIRKNIEECDTTDNKKKKKTDADNDSNDDILFQWESGDPTKHDNPKQGPLTEWYYMPSANSTRARAAGNIIRHAKTPDNTYLIVKYQMIWMSEADNEKRCNLVRTRSFERNHLNLYQADLSGIFASAHDYQRFCDRFMWNRSSGLDSIFKICINKSIAIGLTKKLNDVLLWHAKNVMRHHWKVVKQGPVAVKKRNNFKSSTKVSAAAKNQGRCAITGFLPYKVGNNTNPGGVPTHEDHNDNNPTNNAEENCNRIRADLHHIKTYDEALYNEIVDNMKETDYEFPVKYYRMCEWAKLESPKYQSYLTKKSSHMTSDGIPILYKQECDIYWRVYGDVEPELSPPPYTVSGVRVSVANPEKNKNSPEREIKDEESNPPTKTKALSPKSKNSKLKKVE